MALATTTYNALPMNAEKAEGNEQQSDSDTPKAEGDTEGSEGDDQKADDDDQEGDDRKAEDENQEGDAQGSDSNTQETVDKSETPEEEIGGAGGSDSESEIAGVDLDEDDEKDQDADVNPISDQDVMVILVMPSADTEMDYEKQEYTFNVPIAARVETFTLEYNAPEGGSAPTIGDKWNFGKEVSSHGGNVYPVDWNMTKTFEIPSEQDTPYPMPKLAKITKDGPGLDATTLETFDAKTLREKGWVNEKGEVVFFPYLENPNVTAETKSFT